MTELILTSKDSYEFFWQTFEVKMQFHELKVPLVRMV